MKDCSRWMAWVFGPLLWVLSAQAQVMDHGTFSVRDHLALEAGVGKYSLVQDGNSATVEIFDPQGAHLADCEMAWQASSVTITCTFADGGRYRHFMDLAIPRVELENLKTGERFAADFILPELPEPGIPLADPGPVPPKVKVDVATEGDKTLEEAERDWGAVAKIMALTFAEIQVTLGIELSPRAAEVPGESLEQPTSFFCGDGEVLRCGSGGVNKLTIGVGETGCCTTASGEVDLDCFFLSGFPCCANSFCSIHFCALGLCTCSVLGYLSECVPCI
ncbi:MAG: hypothetical protein KDD47_00775 [Acidobacteria bacterium]|nr:hypothetical protein [Acidobacteriota bacterium]